MKWFHKLLRPTWDHIVSRARGGLNGPNVIAVCWECNISKCHHSVIEWVILLLHKRNYERAETVMAFIERHEPSRLELEALRAAIGSA
jgi:hypothetical protein